MLPLIVLAAGVSDLRPTMQLRARMNAAQHQPRAVGVHASASNEGGPCEQPEVQVPHAQAAVQATGNGARAFPGSHFTRYQNGVFGIVSLQLGWTVLLATATSPTGPLHDLALPWYRPLFLEATTPWLNSAALDRTATDAVASSVPQCLLLWTLWHLARSVTVPQMEQNRFKPSKHLWLATCTLLYSWPVAVLCSYSAALGDASQIIFLGAVPCTAALAAALCSGKPFERSGNIEEVFAKLYQVQCKESNEQAQTELRELLAMLSTAKGWMSVANMPIALAFSCGYFELGDLVCEVTFVISMLIFVSFAYTVVLEVLFRQALLRSESLKKEGDEGWPTCKDYDASFAFELYPDILWMFFAVTFSLFGSLVVLADFTCRLLTWLG